MSRSTRARSSGAGLAALLAAALAGGVLTVAPAAVAAAVMPSVTKTNGAVPAPRFLSAVQASLQARQSGKPVVASALTTPTAQTVANPNGTLTLTQSVTPTRVFQHGAWTGLDGTLKANPDGTFSPAATDDQVVLSGGGRGPLAQMYAGGRGFALTLPIALPRPTVSDDTAVYAGVIPGVDLTVTVSDAGAVSDVFTVHNAAAAHDPRLAQLLDATTSPTRGLHVAADKAGDLAVADGKGRPLFTAPVPTAWDSAKTALPKSAVRDGDPIDPVSTADTLGYGSHRAHLGVTVAGGHVKLTVPAALTGAGTVYSLYIDPTYSPSYPVGKNGWSSPGSGVATQNFWNGTVDYGTGDSDAEVGNSGDVQGEAMSIFNLPIPHDLKGAHIYSANFGITENYSWACPTSGHDQYVNLYAPTQVLTSGNATWNDWVNNLGSQVGHESYALGYNSSCPGNGVSYPLSTSLVASDINSSNPLQTFVLRADDQSDNYAFKEFTPSSAQWTITYDFPPNTPSNLYTSPATTCSGGTTLGDTSVSLYAPVSTPTGSSLTTTFNFYKTSDSTHTNLLTSAYGFTGSDTFTGPSGQAAVMALSESFIARQAGGADTSFSFIATTSDGTLSSAWSTACTFSWDPSSPGAPGVAPNPSPPSGAQTCPTLDNSTGTIQPIGATCSFSLTRPTVNGTPDSISGYVYELNQDPPVTVKTTGDTTINVPVERMVNTLTVSALSAGGNVGAPKPVQFDGSAMNPPAKDGDVTNDGTPDLTVPGNPNSAFGPGLWLAAGNTDGTVATNAVNIGINGLGFNSTATPADWNGAQPITGNFCGNGAQDVMAYFPAGTNAGGAWIACSNGSTTPLQLTLGQTTKPFSMNGGTLVDDNSQTVTQIANGGNTSGKNTGVPDLLATAENQLMVYYSTTPNGYGDQFGCATSHTCYTLSKLNSPDGQPDWNSWTIATTQLSSGTAMYLWNKSTGALDLWTGLKVDSTGTTLDSTSLQQYTIATGWNQNPTHTLLLRAADITGAGIPDLWVTDTTTGSTTGYLPSALANNPTITQVSTTVSTAAHAWHFQDIGTNNSGTQIASTGDSIGSIGLNGTPGANWNTGGMFSPDAYLNSISGGTGDLTSSSQVLTTNAAFTVSVWVDPDQLGGTVLAQNGSTGRAFRIYSDATSGTWRVEMTQSDSSSPVTDVATASAVPALVGQWTYLTATFDPNTNRLVLYVNGIQQAATLHTTLWTPASTGTFTVGSYLASGSQTGYLQGQVADVESWNSTLPATAIAALDHTTIPLRHSYHDFQGDGIDDAALWYDYGTNGSTCTGTDHTSLMSMTGASNYSGNLNAPATTYNNTCFGGGTQYIATGDFNGDGKTDVALFYNYGANGSTCGTTPHVAIYVFYADANGDGGLQAPVKAWENTCFGGGTHTMVAGDFNGDGRAELALFYQYNTTHAAVFTLTSNADGTFSAPATKWDDTSWNGSTINYMAAGDFAGNGKSDLAIFSNPSGSHVTIYTLAADTNGDGGFGPLTTDWDAPTFGGGTQAMISGDFNGDGKTDLALLYNYGSGHLALFTMPANNTGSGVLAPPVQSWNDTTWGTGTTLITSGDYHGDGKSDIALYYDYGSTGSTCTNTDHVRISTMAADTNGDGAFGPLTTTWDSTCFGGGTQFLN